VITATHREDILVIVGDHLVAINLEGQVLFLHDIHRVINELDRGSDIGVYTTTVEIQGLREFAQVAFLFEDHVVFIFNVIVLLYSELIVIDAHADEFIEFIS